MFYDFLCASHILFECVVRRHHSLKVFLELNSHEVLDGLMGQWVVPFISEVIGGGSG